MFVVVVGRGLVVGAVVAVVVAVARLVLCVALVESVFLVIYFCCG